MTKAAWPAWTALALSLLLMAAGAMGWLAKLGLALPLGNLWASGLVVAIGGGPLLLAALALERGRPAPALRSWPAAWVLASLVFASVQVSGGLSSPIYGELVLLGLFLGRQTPWFVALGLALLLGTLEAFPLAMGIREQALSPWPGAIALAWPLSGVLAGWLTQGSLPRAAAPLDPSLHSGQEKSPIHPVSTGGKSWALLDFEQGQPDKLDAEALLEEDLKGTLELAAASHPAWNALALWWGQDQGLSLRCLNLRAGKGAALGTEFPQGEGVLALALREQRPLTVEPLSAGAARTLPYYSEPGPARALQAIPLADEGRQVGLLVCDKAEDQPFSAQESDALVALARSLVAHAQRAAFLRRLQLAAARTNKLYEATRSLASSLDRGDLLRRFGSLLASVVPQDSWTLAWQEQGGSMQRLASEGYNSSAPVILGLQENAALAGVLEQADSAVIFNGDASAVPAALNAGLTHPALHFLLVPLRLGGRLAGILKLDRRLAPFEEDERESALIFGNQAAVTLENARLYSLHQRLATTDGLTGLYNHRYFQERLALELAQAERTGRPLTLALTDIDFFKKFNDTFGHQEGDGVLRKVSELLKAQVRGEKDIVCRYGGEEFVVILPDCDIVEARQVMDALRAYCGAHLIGGTGPEARPITMSIGLCSYPAGAKEQREIIHMADEALYKAKKTGRDRVCSYKDLP